MTKRVNSFKLGPSANAALKKFAISQKVVLPSSVGTNKHSKPREPYDPLKHGVSQTALSIWLTCVEKARLRYWEGLTPEKSKTAFFEGSVYAKLMEKIYQGIKDGKIGNPAEAFTAVQAEIKRIEKEAVTQGKHAQLDLLQETLDIASVLLPSYFIHYHKDFDLEWVYVEGEFSFPVTVDPKTIVQVKGKYDGGYNTKKGFWVFESKFYSRWSDSIADYLPLDLQTCAYTGAASYTGHRLLGCRYNIVRKPQLKRGKKEGRKEFIDRIRSDILDRPAFYFERHDVEFSKAECDANIRRVTYLVKSFINWWRSTDHKSRDLGFNSGACENKYGTCEFLPICSQNDHSKFIRTSGLRHDAV